jgi:hypothetical protein
MRHEDKVRRVPFGQRGQNKGEALSVKVAQGFIFQVQNPAHAECAQLLKFFLESYSQSNGGDTPLVSDIGEQPPGLGNQAEGNVFDVALSMVYPNPDFSL